MQGHGLYVAGGERHAGKTTLSLGLVSHFRRSLAGGAAFIKPLGQKSKMVDGSTVGQDSYLLDQALKLGLPLEHSAPFSASSGAAETFLRDGRPDDIPVRIRHSFRHFASRYEVVIAEGTGHPGVGSVFNLSNARVAALLGIPVLLVLDGGIGSTIDRFSLCRALFDRENVPILGVVVNKVMPEKLDKVKGALGAWFARAGVPVFGYIPYETRIALPSLGVLQRELGAQALTISPSAGMTVNGFMTGFGSSEEILAAVARKPGQALVLSAHRGDVINSILACRLAGAPSGNCGALILCGPASPPSWLVEACARVSLPLFRTAEFPDRLGRDVFKVEPDEAIKIDEIVALVEKHVDIDRLHDSLRSGPPARKAAKRGLLASAVVGSARFISRLFGGGRKRTRGPSGI